MRAWLGPAGEGLSYSPAAAGALAAGLSHDSTAAVALAAAAPAPRACRVGSVPLTQESSAAGGEGTC